MTNRNTMLSRRDATSWWIDNILVPVSLSFMVGIGLSRILPPPSLAVTLWVLLLLACGALILHRRFSRTALFLTLPIFLLLGLEHAVRHLQPPQAADHLYNLVKNRQKLTLTGTLVRMIEFDGNASRMVMSVKEVRFHTLPPSRPAAARGLVRLTARGRLAALQPGDLFMVVATVDRIRNHKIKGGFDYRLFMAGKNIHLSGWIDSPASMLPIIDHDRSMMERCRHLPERLRQRISLFLHDNLDPVSAGMFQALLVGSRAGLPDRIQEQFRATGTMHLLAISGMHMGLLSLLLSLGIGWLMKRSRWLLLHTHVPTLSLVATLPILVIYAFIAGMNIPVLRALTMSGLFLFAIVVQREHTLLNLVALAALLALILQPLALFTASFQLSFSAVLSLALFYPRLRRMVVGKADTPGTRFFRLVLAAILLSLVATAGTLPFMLLHFNRISLVGPVMNLLIEPLLCFWALPLGLLAIPWIFLKPTGAILLLKTGGLGINGALSFTRLGSALPGSCLWTVTPTWLEILIYGLLLTGCFLFWKNRIARPVLAAIALLLVLSFTRELWLPSHDDQTRVSFLDMGQGTAILLRLEDGPRILLDCGATRSSRFDVGRRLVAPYLWKERIWRLDRVIVTHPHQDHFNGMEFILRHFQPRLLHINGMLHGERGYDRLLEVAAGQHISIQVPTAGETICQGKNSRLVCLGMNGLPGVPATIVNDNSLVFRLDHGRRSFLFPADISRRGEAILLDAGAPLRADVLQAPHHGSRGSGSEPFISRIAPRLIVISAGRYRLGTYPALEHVNHWQEQGIQTWITGARGSLTCSTDGRTLRCGDFQGNDIFSEKYLSEREEKREKR